LGLWSSTLTISRAPLSIQSEETMFLTIAPD
jgi:hypothetical protein